MVQVRPPSVEWKTRAAGPPVAKKISSSPESVRHELLAANAPSLPRAGGILSVGSGFQCSPSVVFSKRNLPLMGSPRAKHSFAERQAIVSRKNSLRLSEYCRFQVWPPSAVL